jgi:uncharacterized repeat protein (TIGR03803 family)
MRTFFVTRFALYASAVVLISGCGGAQSPIAAPGAIPQNVAAAGTRTAVIHQLTTSSYEVLHAFGRHPDVGHNHGGATPWGGLLDVGGVLYGTTNNGGYHDNGTVFSITTGGKKKTLYEFRGDMTDGAEPNGNLIDVNGTLYGATSSGGTCGQGTDFSITKSGTEKVLHSFCSEDGLNPTGGLIEVKGLLYGATFQGGLSSSDGWGVVYRISPSGTFKKLYTFANCNKRSPCGLSGGLAYINGVFYGTSLYGGNGCPDNGGCGTVYAVTMSGKGSLLYSFQNGSDGFFPTSGLIDVGGQLYGTTFYGGQSGCHDGIGCGTIFTISPSGTEQVLYRFAGTDGGNPYTALAESDGTFYGTTLYGGVGCSDIDGCGTVFGFSSSGSEQILHYFQGGKDGIGPLGSLIEVNGALYGTTHDGGTTRGCGGDGCGTVYAVTP